MLNRAFYSFHFELDDLVTMLEQFSRQTTDKTKEMIDHCYVSVGTSRATVGEDGRLPLLSFRRLFDFELRELEGISLKQRFTIRFPRIESFTFVLVLEIVHAEIELYRLQVLANEVLSTELHQARDVPEDV